MHHYSQPGSLKGVKTYIDRKALVNINSRFNILIALSYASNISDLLYYI